MRKELAYTVVAASVTVFFMVIYNFILMHGLDFKELNFWQGFCLEMPVAWVFINLFNPFIEKMLDKCKLAPYNKAYRFMRPLFTVAIMAPIMTFYVVLYKNPGQSVTTILSFWKIRVLCNIPFVYVMQIFAIKPIADFIFMNLLSLKRSLAN